MRDDHRAVVRQHPKFISSLFNYILVPILTVLTVVLLIWTLKEVIFGAETEFLRLEGIATAYAIAGIWLHILLTSYTTPMADFYKRVYPVSALVILLAEIWVILQQLKLEQLKEVTYYFMLVWLCALVSIITLVLMKAKAHAILTIVVIVASVVSVLPVVGAQALPISVQVSRLERLLTTEGMLHDEHLVSATKPVDQAKRQAITDAVLYLAYAKEADLPLWFNKDWAMARAFEAEMGFAMEPMGSSAVKSPTYSYLSTSLEGSGALDVMAYEWMIGPSHGLYNRENAVTFTGIRGQYQVMWLMDDDVSHLPRVRIFLDDVLVLEETMHAFMDAVMSRYPLGDNSVYQLDINEMTVEFSNEFLDVMIVFEGVYLSLDPEADNPNYRLPLSGIYIHEK